MDQDTSPVQVASADDGRTKQACRLNPSRVAHQCIVPCAKRSYVAVQQPSELGRTMQLNASSPPPTYGTRMIHLHVLWDGEITTFRTDPTARLSALMRAFCEQRSCELSRMCWYSQGRLIRHTESPMLVCPLHLRTLSYS